MGIAKSQTRLSNWTTILLLIVVGSIPDPEGVDCSSVGRTKWRHMEFGNSIPHKQVCTGLAFYTVFPRQFESILSSPRHLWSWLSPYLKKKKKDISSLINISCFLGVKDVTVWLKSGSFSSSHYSDLGNLWKSLLWLLCKDTFVPCKVFWKEKKKSKSHNRCMTLQILNNFLGFVLKN